MKVKVKKAKKKNPDKNPYPKYSYSSGLIMEDGSPVWGLDIKWSMFEIEHGRLPK